MHDFKKLATMTPRELAWLSGPPTVAAPPVTTGIGLGPDASQFEMVASDPGATARLIIKAAATRDVGGPLAAKMSDAAQQIIDAGVRRRAGG
jgi:hypothetical protein